VKKSETRRRGCEGKNGGLVGKVVWESRRDDWQSQFFNPDSILKKLEISRPDFIKYPDIDEICILSLGMGRLTVI
jgi:hypothetical protein